MTYGILNSINKKDKLYKLLLKSDVNSNSHADLEARFKQYRETLRSIIKEANRLYYHRQWCSGGGATGAIAPVPIF